MDSRILPPLAAMCLIALASGAWAAGDGAVNRQLLRLDPATRLEQACDYEVMIRISRKHPRFVADRVVAYTFKDPVIEGNAITAPGAAFRSKGEWYHLSYTCETGPRHLKVHQLQYRIGQKVPRDDWTTYNLYD